MQKKNRLRKNHEFQKIIQKNKSEISKYLVIYFSKNNLGYTRIGISVSKKFINAVGRNKIRRQVRAIMDNINNFNKSLDVVLIVRKPFITTSYAKKFSAIKETWERI